MKPLVFTATYVAATVLYSSCYAGCNCDDWMVKGGYCVDYVKTKVPSFPIPLNTTEIAALKNKDIPEVTEGDVALFSISNYWHVAYVEKVHLDQHGNVTAIDVSEMNFGDQLSFNEFRKKWKQKSKSEWKRAICCGVTDNYDETGARKNVALNTVKQLWSPVVAASESAKEERDDTAFDKIREALNRFLQFTGREL
jgi:hypothetical protein